MQIARITTIRTVLALVALQGWSIYQMDGKVAFLNGDLKEEVYVEHLPGFVISAKVSMV